MREESLQALTLAYLAAYQAALVAEGPPSISPNTTGARTYPHTPLEYQPRCSAFKTLGVGRLELRIVEMAAKTSEGMEKLKRMYCLINRWDSSLYLLNS